MTGKRVELAFVGVTHIHTPGFVRMLKARAGEVMVKSVWDPDAARAKAVAEELDAQLAADVAGIWNDPQIKAVIICSETAAHQQLVTAAAKAGKDIFAEKPLGIAAEDAYEMARAINAAGVRFQTGYSSRSDAKMLFIRQQVQNGAFGTITRVRGSVTHDGALQGWFDGEWRWMADPKSAGFGGYGDLGTHMLDIMIWLLGDVSRVTAVVSNGTGRYPNCDELGTGLIVFKNGAIGDLSAGWDDVANPVTLEVCGTKAHAAIINGQLYFKTAGQKGDTPVSDLPPRLAPALDLFIDAVTGKPDVPLVSANEAAYRSAVTEALYKSAADQTWVKPQPPITSAAVGS